MIRVLRLLAVALVAVACREASPDDAPSALVASPATWDVGALYLGEACDAEFTITNRSAETLDRLVARTSCGCAVLRWESPRLEPGASGVLRAHFDAKGEPGPMKNRSVRLLIGERGPVALEIPIQADLSPLYEFDPPVVAFPRSTRGEAVEAQSVTVRALDGSSLTAIGIESNRWCDGMLRASSEGVLSAQLQPARDVRIGEHRGLVRIITDHPRQPFADIPATWTVDAPVDLAARHLDLGTFDASIGATLDATVVRRRDDVRVVGLHVEPIRPDDRIDVSWDADRGVVTLVVAPGAEAGPVQGRVDVTFLPEDVRMRSWTFSGTAVD